MLGISIPPSLDSLLCSYKTWAPATTIAADAMDINERVSLRYQQPGFKIFPTTSDDVLHGFTTSLHLLAAGQLRRPAYLPTYLPYSQAVSVNPFSVAKGIYSQADAADVTKVRKGS